MIAFTVDGRELTWEQIFALTPAESFQPITEEEFRRGRDLISAADVVRWLDRWQLDLEDWRAWLSGAPTDRWTDAVCSGALERKARELAEELALAAVVSKRRPAINERLPARAALARDGFRSEVDPRQAQTVAQRNLLAWTEVEIDAVPCARESSARELVLMVRDDGRSLAEAAALAGALRYRISEEVHRLPNPEALLLSAAQVGEIVGPLDPGLRVLQVVGRRPPRDALERAVEQLVRERVSRELALRVEWAAA